MRLSLSSAAAVVTVIVVSAAVRAAPLRVLYNDHPPFMYTRDGEVLGLAAEPAAAAMRAAGIDFVWEESPATRQLELIRRNVEPLCAVGRFRVPDREAYAVFTRPVYVERPRVVLGRVDDPVLAAAASLDEVLRDQRLTLMLKRSYSLGATIDAEVERLAVRKWETWVEADVMFRQIAAGRADYMIVAPEELDHVFGDLPREVRERLAAYRLSGMPPGEARTVMCSRATPPEVIRAIDARLPAPASESAATPSR